MDEDSATSVVGRVPSAVMKRCQRAARAGWQTKVSVRVRERDGALRTSVVFRAQCDGLRFAACHVDGQTRWCYVNDHGTVQRISFPELDALLK